MNAFDTTWPQALAEQLVAWARQLHLDLGAPIAETLQRCAAQLEAERAAGHVLLPVGAVDAARLQASGLVGADASGGLPLVLDGGALYLARDWEHEQALAARLAALWRSPPEPIAREPLRSLFPAREGDWQALAVAQALRQRLTVISGGPGTGKTSTVLRLLACVLAAQPEARIRLAAPTGKAAQRLLEALQQGLERLPAAQQAALETALPAEALTLHRLLGAGPKGFAAAPLALDWLMVDEASMLDLGLARALLDALPPGARLVLLGDRHQLAAVENGAVLAELSRAPAWSEATRAALQQALDLPALSLPAEGALPDLAVLFTHSHRFAGDSGIGRLAAAVREGDSEAALALLAEGAADLQAVDDWRPVLQAGLQPYAQALLQLAAAPHEPALEDAVWTAWDGFRVLCAGHQGPLGTAAVNRAASALLTEALGPSAPGLGQAWLVTRNQGQLVNGDVLLMLPGADGRLHPRLRRGAQSISAAQLPEDRDGGFAMTVHKAQGSEFGALLLLVPGLSWLTREWLYTGITRARQRLLLLGSEPALRGAIARPTERRSGLGERLRHLSSAPPC